jgi:hypothetical protein
LIKLRIKSRLKIVLLAAGVALGMLLLGFSLGYFVIFSQMVTPPNSADGQNGLPEFVRFYDSLLLAIGCAVTGFVTVLWRFWRRS